jgi:hypothetical protein
MIVSKGVREICSVLVHVRDKAVVGRQQNLSVLIVKQFESDQDEREYALGSQPYLTYTRASCATALTLLGTTESSSSASLLPSK